jgi:hypothetical protein
MKTDKKLLRRFKESWFPPSAVVGALSSFVDSARGSQAQSTGNASQDGSLAQIGLSGSTAEDISSQKKYDIEYCLTLILGESASDSLFRSSLSGISVGASDKIYALGDGEVRIFESGGDRIANWRAPEYASCLEAGPDERVYIGSPGRVEIYDSGGKRLEFFAAGGKDKPALVTAIKIFGDQILVADAAARYIRRYNRSGIQLGEIGTQNRTRSFMLPNRSLDMDIDAEGTIRATDSGRHRVTSWLLDGSPQGYFGKFGFRNPQDFVGCCNPVNLTVLPDGKIVTAEKLIARVKVYNPEGELRALIGPEHFDPKCTHLYLATDSKYRILVADPIRREIRIFSPAKTSGGQGSV